MTLITEEKKLFYKKVFFIAIPVMIQNGITNFVGLLDNIMVGRIGTEEMSGVAIINQLLFVFNLCIFGGISGATIFGAQFYGKKDYEGVKNSLRFKLVMGFVIVLLCYIIFIFLGRELISLYLHEGGDTGDISQVLHYGENYLKIILIELIPFMLIQVYAITLRETGETVVPMVSGVIAVVVNMILNYLLIFGKFGAPKLGVYGAAIATVISRVVECIIVIWWTHKHVERNPFIVNLYKNFMIPKELFKKIMIKGMPLLVNETLWASGMAVLVQCYSKRGLAVVVGYNISSTISNLFNVVYFALGAAVSIIVGQLLGSKKFDEAKETAGRLILFSALSCIVVGIIMAICSPFFPRIYVTDDNSKHLATCFICISAFFMPVQAFLHATYFTIRSGGKTLITFLFDSVFVWIVSIPAAYMLTRFTGLNILVIFIICQSLDIIKCIIGYILMKKGIWLQNIVDEI